MECPCLNSSFTVIHLLYILLLIVFLSSIHCTFDSNATNSQLIQVRDPRDQRKSKRNCFIVSNQEGSDEKWHSFAPIQRHLFIAIIKD